MTGASAAVGPCGSGCASEWMRGRQRRSARVSARPSAGCAVGEGRATGKGRSSRNSWPAPKQGERKAGGTATRGKEGRPWAARTGDGCHQMLRTAP